MISDIQYATDAKRDIQPSRSETNGPTPLTAFGRSDNYTELKYRSTQNLSTAGLAKGLGLFSIALGLAEVVMPTRIGKLAGIGSDHRKILPLLGIREIAHGVTILKSDNPKTGVTTRIAGDAIDLTYLAASFLSDDSNKKRLSVSAIAVLGVTALDILCAQRLSDDSWQQVELNPLSPTTIGQSSGRRLST